MKSKSDELKFSLADNQICYEPQLLSNFEIGANIDTPEKWSGKMQSSWCIFKNLKIIKMTYWICGGKICYSINMRRKYEPFCHPKVGKGFLNMIPQKWSQEKK